MHDPRYYHHQSLSNLEFFLQILQFHGYHHTKFTIDINFFIILTLQTIGGYKVADKVAVLMILKIYIFKRHTTILQKL